MNAAQQKASQQILLDQNRYYTRDAARRLEHQLGCLRNHIAGLYSEVTTAAVRRALMVQRGKCAELLDHLSDFLEHLSSPDAQADIIHGIPDDEGRFQSREPVARTPGEQFFADVAAHGRKCEKD